MCTYSHRFDFTQLEIKACPPLIKRTSKLSLLWVRYFTHGRGGYISDCYQGLSKDYTCLHCYTGVFGTSVYLLSSSSAPTDLWSQSHCYISVACPPIKILYSCPLVYADLAPAFPDLCSSDCCQRTCPRPCQSIVPKHAGVDRNRGANPPSRPTGDGWRSANCSPLEPFTSVLARCPSRLASVCP